MKMRISSQKGAALIVALVAMIVLTVLGVATMSDVMNQSTVVRNEQFRQQVFYAVSSELNVQVDSVNNNPQEEDDQIILDLVAQSPDGLNLTLEIDDTGDHPIFTNPEDVTLTAVRINGNRIDSFGCPGESIGKVKVVAGTIDATATLNDGATVGGGIQSQQSQRYVYCWP